MDWSIIFFHLPYTGCGDTAYKMFLSDKKDYQRYACYNSSGSHQVLPFDSVAVFKKVQSERQREMLLLIQKD